MESDDDMEIDSTIAASMGFASFGSKPGEKRKYNPNDGYVDPSISSHAQNTKPPSIRTQTTPGAPLTISKDNVGTTAPASKKAVTLEEASLEDLRNGVRNENGDMVYFKPSFIEDPWKDLKPR